MVISDTAETVVLKNNFIGYASILNKYNTSTYKAAKEILNERLSEIDLNNSSIATTGSDGRFEKSTFFSPIELILIQERENQELQNVLEDLIVEYSDFFYHKLEIKNLNKDDMVYYSGDRKKTYPTRIIDALQITGSKDLFLSYKSSLINELSGRDGKHKMKSFSDKRREPKRILNSEYSYEERHFDKDGGRLFFDNIRVKSTKYGHLRSVQYKIGLEICKKIRRDESTSVIRELPKLTTERLNYFFYSKMSTLSMWETEDIIHAYDIALYWYHLSEKMFRIKNQKSINVEKKSIKKITHIISNFNKKGRILR